VVAVSPPFPREYCTWSRNARNRPRASTGERGPRWAGAGAGASDFPIWVTGVAMGPQAISERAGTFECPAHRPRLPDGRARFPGPERRLSLRSAAMTNLARTAALATALLLPFSALAAAPPPKPADNDPLLAALTEELGRSFKSLQAKRDAGKGE